MNKEKTELLDTIKEYLDKLIPVVQNTADTINSGNSMEAMKMIPVLADGIDYICQGVTLTKEIHSYDIDSEKLKNSINEMIQSIENDDMVVLSDILTYELLPVLEETKKAINK